MRPNRRGLRLSAALVPAISCLLGLAAPAFAQSLNEEVVRLLNANCTELGNGSIPTDPNEFGSNLLAICDVPTTSAGASSGGGAASVQSSTVSIRNGVIQQRLERARGQKREEATDSAALSREAVFALSRSGRDDTANLLPADAPDDPGSDVRGGRFDVFVSGALESLDRDLTRFEDGYDSSIAAATVGADYRFSDAVVGGVVLTLTQQDGDFDGGGDFDMESLDPSLFVAYLPTPQTFLQAVVGLRDQQFDVKRAVDFTVDRGGTGVEQLTGVSRSETDSSVSSAGLLFGYDRSVRRFTFGPRVGLNYSRTRIDGFVETGGTGLELQVEDTTVKSLQAVAGFYGSVALSARSGVFLPQVNVEYVNEFEDSQDRLTARFVEDLRGSGATRFTYQTNEPDTGFFNLEAGVAAVFPRGIQPYVNVRTMFGNTNFESLAGTFGVRFEL